MVSLLLPHDACTTLLSRVPFTSTRLELFRAGTTQLREKRPKELVEERLERLMSYGKYKETAER